jgi:DNA-binding NarL/FixJ family response regulator
MYDNICRLIEPSISKAGRAHFTAQLQDNSDANVLVYRLELASFAPCYDIYIMQVDHIDDNPNNNMLSNLQWLTPAQNLAKALATGKIRSTDDNTFYNIMMNVYDGKSDKEIGKMFNLSSVTIRNMRLGKGPDNMYSDAMDRLGLYPVNYGFGKLSEDDYVKIMDMVNDGYSDDSIATNFPISATTVSAIRRGDGIYGNILHNLGLQPVYKITVPTDSDIIIIFEMVKNGYSDEEISGKLKFPIGTITNVRLGKGAYKDKLSKLNIQPIYLDNRMTDDAYRKLYSYIQQGLSDSEVATLSGLSDRTVREFRTGQGPYTSILNRLNLEPISHDRDISDEDIVTVMTFIAKNYPNNVDEEAAKLVNISARTVRNIRSGNTYTNISRLERLGFKPITYESNLNIVTDEEVIKIMELVHQGLSDDEIENITGRSNRVVRKIRTKDGKYKEVLERLGIEGVNRGVSISQDQYTQIISMAKTNTPIIEIANKVNLSTPTVSKIIRGQGVHADKLKQYGLSPVNISLSNDIASDEVVKKIYDMYTNGSSSSKISKEVNISRPTIMKILHGVGIYKEILERLSLTPIKKE